MEGLNPSLRGKTDLQPQISSLYPVQKHILRIVKDGPLKRLHPAVLLPFGDFIVMDQLIYGNGRSIRHEGAALACKNRHLHRGHAVEMPLHRQTVPRPSVSPCCQKPGCNNCLLCFPLKDSALLSPEQRPGSGLSESRILYLKQNNFSSVSSVLPLYPAEDIMQSHSSR